MMIRMSWREIIHITDDDDVEEIIIMVLYIYTHSHLKFCIEKSIMIVDYVVKRPHVMNVEHNTRRSRISQNMIGII